MTEGTRAYKVRVTIDSIDPMYDTPELRAKYITPHHSESMKTRVTVHVDKILEQLPCIDMQKYLDAYLEIEKVEIYHSNTVTDVLLAEYWNPDREQKKKAYREKCWGFADSAFYFHEKERHEQ